MEQKEAADQSTAAGDDPFHSFYGADFVDIEVTAQRHEMFDFYVHTQCNQEISSLIIILPEIE